MSSYCLIIIILLPILFSLFNFFFRINNEKHLKLFSFICVVLTSILTWIFIFTIKDEAVTLLKINEYIIFKLKFDGLGKIFAGMVSILWIVALIYAYNYMKHDNRRRSYSLFYIMTYGVVLGIATSGNLLTMYVFYELLTFVTLPLIIHKLSKEAKRAGRNYLYFSLAGSSLALAGIIILTLKTGTTEFVFGGNTSEILSLAYILTFFGFGVKASVYPLCYWLPQAGVAPTPTTALLHAVAVVKSGAFAIIRSTYYSFNYQLLNNSLVQKIALGFIIFTIIYGSTKALKEQHLKRRFAYSTISNLSYILLGVLLCSKFGLLAGLIHFIIHSITKICIFFVCGAIIETNEITYVYELNSMAKKAPKIFAIYTIAGLSLIGVPLFGGFVSKYYLISACIKENNIFAYLGVFALIISAILTAIYTLNVTFRGIFIDVNKDSLEKYQTFKEVDRTFLFTTGFFAVLCVVLGICANPLIKIISSLLGGLL